MLKKLLLYTCSFMLTLAVSSQELRDNFYVKVLSEELNRNIQRLSLPDLGKPFLISYKLRNMVSQTIRAERGRIVTPFPGPAATKTASVKLLVGDYHRNFDYLFDDGSYIMLPDENNSDELRRLLWLETDRAYKATAQQYNATMAALKRVTVDQKELDLDDLTKIHTGVKDFGSLPVVTAASTEHWSPLLQKLSAMFVSYPQITSSSCYLTINHAEEYLVSSEGAVIRRPVSQVVLTIAASMPGNDGSNIFETYNDYVTRLDELPDYKILEDTTRALIRRMLERDKAPKFEGSYLGPVLFEGEALANLISGFFRYSLGVNRKSILYPDNNTTFYEDKIGQKLIASGLTLTALPHLKTYDGRHTTGAFDVDYNGVVPPDTLELIREGVLKSLLNGRTPTRKFEAPGGFAFGERTYSAGVLRLTADTVAPINDMKKELVKAAKEEGLPYAYIVRDVNVSYGQAPYLYRIDTATLREEMLTGFKFTSLNMRSLRRFIIAADQMHLWNQPLYSVICPQSMVIGEIELEAENSVVKAKPIIVSNPLLDKKPGKTKQQKKH
ncbi:metallopeptidase TldD-related protein [Niabella drilacis]|uniref:Putative modulator of DNA gyrase n=1 Tax=Niabella drilacis (strain DSM 25811 / CCM 8410 / CCUG 62505 / LMG 26954 / E90) TaxID=1285928 RepID=A0A1G6WFA4_NIADE|nr:metallopeptidase TldD-related protein [Niabella drilacis]SDD64630.1 Putative modulator of DNA gyrase [Niabella drilacis]